MFDIEIVKVAQTDELLKRTLQHCWGAKGNLPKKKLFACSDSINEIPEYWIFCNAPRSVAMQMRTHEKKHGTYFWMGTARPDRADAVKGEYSREQIVPFCMKLTARAIKEISHYRLCMKAEESTRNFMYCFRRKMFDIEPDLAAQMMPMCQYRNGICTELNSCKRNGEKE